MPNKQSARQAALDAMFSALADPTRRAIVERLARGSASVSELARPSKLSLPAVVQHLQALEACGLVKTAKHGRVRTCRLAPKRLAVVTSWLDAQRLVWESRTDRLEAYLEEMEDDD